MYRKAKIRVVVMLLASALVFLAGVLYLSLGRRFDIYDWKFGLLSVAFMVISLSVFSVYFREFYALFVAPRCPRCDGVLQVTEISLRGKTTFGELTLPPILDRVSECTLCQREHHHVFAKWNEAGTTAPIHLGDSFNLMIHNKASLMQLRRPAMTDEEIAKLYSSWDSYPKEPETTRKEWDALLKRLQREARAKNVEAGMIFPTEKT